MMPNKPGVGAAAAMAAVRSTAAMVAEAPAAAALTIPGGRGGKVGMADLMPRHAGMGHHSAAGAAQQGAHQHSHAVAVKQEGPAPQQQSVQAAAAAATAGGEPQLGRGKRVRKPQQWSQQMQLLDQLVDSVEHSAGSSGDFHAHPGQAAAAAAVGGGAAAGDGGPAAKRQRRAGPGLQQGSGPGFEDDEADESYDAAADANGDEEEAAELAEYEEELMQVGTTCKTVCNRPCKNICNRPKQSTYHVSDAGAVWLHGGPGAACCICYACNSYWVILKSIPLVVRH